MKVIFALVVVSIALVGAFEVEDENDMQHPGHHHREVSILFGSFKTGFLDDLWFPACPLWSNTLKQQRRII